MDRKEISWDLDLQEISYSNTCGIFTMKLADGSMDRMDDILTDRWAPRWNHIGVDIQMSHVTDIWMDLSWY